MNNDPLQPCDRYTDDPKSFNCVCGVSENLHPGGTLTFLGYLREYSGATVGEVDKWVEWWQDHGGIYNENLITMRALLGLTKEQYGRWMREGNEVLREFVG